MYKVERIYVMKKYGRGVEHYTTRIPKYFIMCGPMLVLFIILLHNNDICLKIYVKTLTFPLYIYIRTALKNSLKQKVFNYF